MTTIWDPDGSIHSRIADALAAEVYTCSFCNRPAVGGPMCGVELHTGANVYCCEVHFLTVRSANNMPARRLAREARRWKNK